MTDQRSREPARHLPAARPARPRHPIGLTRRFVAAVRDDDITGIGAEIAFRYLFAVFPFGLFIAAMSAYVAIVLHVSNPAGAVITGLGHNLPASLATTIKPELQRLLASARPDLMLVGGISALIAASTGTNALVKAMHRAYDVPEARPAILRYAIAVGLTLVAAVVVILSFVVIIGGPAVTGWVAQVTGLGKDAGAVLDIVRWPLVFLWLTAAVTLLYRYAPNVVVPWRWLLAGSAAFTAGWLIATWLLGLYVDNASNYGTTYGSLAGVIVLMIWFYLTAMLLVLGVEVSAAFAWERTPDEIKHRAEEARVAAKIQHATHGSKQAAHGDLARPGSGP